MRTVSDSSDIHVPQNRVEKIFLRTIKDITGIDGASDPLGSVRVSAETNAGSARAIHDFFKFITRQDKNTPPDIRTGNKKIFKKLLALFETAKKVFIDYYDNPARFKYLTKQFSEYQKEQSRNQRARIITEIWAPELSIQEKSIIKRWKLHNVEKAQNRIAFDQVVIQLNALYTAPESIPADIDEDIATDLKKLPGNYGLKIAEYDHPVPLFCPDKEHELLSCLKELDGDIAFEKSIGTFTSTFKFPVVVSLSQAYQNLDHTTELWVKRCILNQRFHHLKVLLLSEGMVDLIKKMLLKKPFDAFSVQGQYARHFNTLKYMQLLLERAYGIRAGFKLDTDEGIRSRDLFNATGRSWFQTLCHEYWGGKAVNWRGEDTYLGENIGEYVNNTDISSLGFKKALREPDVKPPESAISPDIFFNKSFAHSFTTALYNRFDRIEDFISHPVVKGGGYGIDNEGLRRFVPFTLSCVGRAEDQQFYFYGLSKGLRGIFHPDLRIAHYKDRFSSAESKTAAQRFVGDMYRLVLFSHLAELLGVKEEIDPMPGIFAGRLAFCQAFFNTIYRAYVYFANGENSLAEYLIDDGIDEITALFESIQKGVIRRMLEDERKQWTGFVNAVDEVESYKARTFFDRHFIF